MTISELSRWQSLCHDELAVLFDAAHEGLTPFLEAELLPLHKNLLRAADLPTNILDVAAMSAWGVRRMQGHRSPVILPSERRMARAFARWCLGPEAVDGFVVRTFDLVGDALARRVGHAQASELCEDAADMYLPTRREALRRVLVGPEVLRVLSGPGTYFATPMLAGAASMLLGPSDRLDPETLTLVRAALMRLGVPTRAQARPGDKLRRLALTTGLSILGAGVITTSAYHFVDLHGIYARHLESIEDILLFGQTAHDGTDCPSYGPGLLELLSKLEAVPVAATGRLRA